MNVTAHNVFNDVTQQKGENIRNTCDKNYKEIEKKKNTHFRISIKSRTFFFYKVTQKMRSMCSNVGVIWVRHKKLTFLENVWCMKLNSVIPKTGPQTDFLSFFCFYAIRLLFNQFWTKVPFVLRSYLSLEMHTVKEFIYNHLSNQKGLRYGLFFLVFLSQSTITRIVN